MVCQSDLLPITTATFCGFSLVICQLFYSFLINCIPLPTNVFHYYLTFLSPASYARDPFLPIPIRPQGIGRLVLTYLSSLWLKAQGSGLMRRRGSGSSWTQKSEGRSLFIFQ